MTIKSIVGNLEFPSACIVSEKKFEYKNTNENMLIGIIYDKIKPMDSTSKIPKMKAYCVENNKMEI